MFNELNLKDADLDTYLKNGFVVVRQGLNLDEMEQIKTWSTELMELPDAKDSYWVYRERDLRSKGEDNDLISRIEMIGQNHTGFHRLNLFLKQIISSLFKEEAILFKDKLNYKMPGGDGFKPHQDSQAGWDVYASEFITAMVSVDPATIDNGCLYIADGPHEKKVIRQWEPLNEADLASMRFQAYPTNPGDLVFFHSYVPHYSNANLSDQMRRLYYATFNTSSEGDHHHNYHKDKFANYPPDIYRQTGKRYEFKV